jgi:transcriptional regulator with GAF, ATPase, and Fis domain
VERRREPDRRALQHIERLVADLAARFVNIPSIDVDEAIVDSQRQIVESLGLDRSALFQVDGDDLVSTHVWTRPECEVPISRTSAGENFPWYVDQLRAGKTVVVSDLDRVPSKVDRDSLARIRTMSNVVVPLIAGGDLLGGLTFASMRTPRSWPEDLVGLLQLIGNVFSQALARRRSHEELTRALSEVNRLRDILSRDNEVLHREVKALRPFSPIVAESAAARLVLERLAQVAPTTATVLIEGETGAGKEVFAQEIHDRSPRHRRPMVRVNCGAIPTALLESELFGHERGAFTGAIARQVGRFELAEGSTIFLDEISELPLDAQVKLLRVVQDRVIERLGSAQPIRVDVRVIAATNRNLEAAVAARTFREDLFYRLNVFPITVPPLRERAEDIPVLVWSFVEEFSKAFGKSITTISREDMAALQRYPWPGNIRELRNVVEYSMIVATGPRLSIQPPTTRSLSLQRSLRLADVETSHIQGVLERTNWRVRGRGGAAEVLGLKPTTLEGRMAKLGIRRPESPSFRSASV